FVAREFGHAPIGQHAGVQEILVDRGEFVLQRQIQVFERLGVAALWRVGAGRGQAWGGGYSAAWGCGPRGLCSAASSIVSIVSWHRPQFLLTPLWAYTSHGEAAPDAMAARILASFSLLQTQTIIQGILHTSVICCSCD